MSTRQRTNHSSSVATLRLPPYGYTESPDSSVRHHHAASSSSAVHHNYSAGHRSLVAGLAPPPPPQPAGTRAQRVKNCMRTTIAFMCTQVGVGGLIVVYALVGAASFVSIETNANHTASQAQHNEAVARMRRGCADRLWTVAERHNVLNRAVWRLEVDRALRDYQQNVTLAIRNGYDGHTVQQRWTFPAALMFCLSVFSMIGYGNLTPRTSWGKVMTMVYATFGIPLYILYFLNIGRVLARTLRWAYAWMYQCTRDPDDDDAGGAENDDDGGELIEYGPDGQLRCVQRPPAKRRVIVPSTACLWVMCVYIVIGTLMFAHWENWNYLDAVYFCVTSLCKIGMGDFVPGTTANHTISVLGYTIQDSQNSQNQTKLVINFVYMLIGMGLVAMCYNLMREDVRMKCKEMNEDMALCMEDVRVRFSRCFGGGGGGARHATAAIEAV